MQDVGVQGGRKQDGPILINLSCGIEIRFRRTRMIFTDACCMHEFLAEMRVPR